MQENEFEKQVKHLMEGFKPVPSDEAWAKISRRLKEKRRRRLPFIFLLATGLAAAGLLFYFTNDRQTTIQNSVASNSNANASQDSAVVKPGIAVPNDEAEKNSTDDKSLSAPGKDQATSIRNDGNKRTSIPSNTIKDNASNSSQHENITTAEEQPGNVVTNANSNNADAAIQKDIQPAPSETATAASENPVNKTSDADTGESLVKSNSKNTPVAKPVLPNNKLPKWQWGINAFYGENHAVKSLVHPEKSPALEPALYSPTAIISGDTVFNKHAYTSSSAYSFGVEVQRSISKNSVITAGLNYTHLSTESRVRGVINGNYAIAPDNIVNNYYRPGIVKDYINKYNFIELPVSFQQNVIQRKLFAFGYNAGFSVRQLLNSNSLIYNEKNNIYFSNTGLLQKTQWQAQAGLNLKFNTGKTTSVYAGPQFSYSLSNFTKGKNNGNYHFMTYGLKAGFLFHKK